MDNQGHIIKNKSLKNRDEESNFDNIVLEKSIFSNIFEKDIQRVYLYKKSEMIAKAIHLISPAFKESKTLKDRLHRISVEIVDAALLTPSAGKEVLARELLALVSLLKMAKTSSLLSGMNADIITREAHTLLQELAAYTEPKVALEESPSLAVLQKESRVQSYQTRSRSIKIDNVSDTRVLHENIGQPYIGQKTYKKDQSRRETILSVLRSKGPSYIKDISILFKDVSEKTIQRELQNLVFEGVVSKTGERRWTVYTLKDTSPAA